MIGVVVPLSFIIAIGRRSTREQSPQHSAFAMLTVGAVGATRMTCCDAFRRARTIHAMSCWADALAGMGVVVEARSAAKLETNASNSGVDPVAGTKRAPVMCGSLERYGSEVRAAFLRMKCDTGTEGWPSLQNENCDSSSRVA